LDIWRAFVERLVVLGRDRGTEVLVGAEVRVAFISERRAQPIPKSIRALMKADLD
jgi:acyl-CoA thioesterase FadM